MSDLELSVSLEHTHDPTGMALASHFHHGRFRHRQTYLDAAPPIHIISNHVSLPLKMAECLQTELTTMS